MKHSLALILALLLQVGVAQAHAGLANANPGKDATVAAPSTLSLTFTEAVTLAFTGLILTGPDGAIVPTGAASLAADGMTITVPTAAPLAPGSYTVEWHALSVDGHKVHGSYGFAVK